MEAGGNDAPVMPSWSPSDSPNDEATPAPSAPAAEVDKARRLLEELFADAPDDEAPDQREP